MSGKENSDLSNANRSLSTDDLSSFDFTLNHQSVTDDLIEGDINVKRPLSMGEMQIIPDVEDMRRLLESSSDDSGEEAP